MKYKITNIDENVIINISCKLLFESGELDGLVELLISIF